jgi:hypothetical protein
MYRITVLGLPFLEPNTRENYYLKNLILDETTDQLYDFAYKKDIKDEIKNGNIKFISDGVDVGAVDATSWVRAALDNEGNYIVTHALPEVLNKNIKKNKEIVRQVSVDAIIELMKMADTDLDINKTDENGHPIFTNNSFVKQYVPILMVDNDIMCS